MASVEDLYQYYETLTDAKDKASQVNNHPYVNVPIMFRLTVCITLITMNYCYMMITVEFTQTNF